MVGEEKHKKKTRKDENGEGQIRRKGVEENDVKKE